MQQHLVQTAQWFLQLLLQPLFQSCLDVKKHPTLLQYQRLWIFENLQSLQRLPRRRHIHKIETYQNRSLLLLDNPVVHGLRQPMPLILIPHASKLCMNW